MNRPAARRNESDLSPREGLFKRLKAVVASLDEATERMQCAIVGQNVGNIWNVLAEQERIAAEFQQSACLWGHLASAGRGNPEIERGIAELNSSFENVKRKNRCNMALIKNFLSVVDKAFRASGTHPAKKPVVYGRRGKLQYRQSSIALSQEG